MALAVAGCAGFSVRAERDASVLIPTGATYAWNPRPGEPRLPGEQDYRSTNPVLHDRLTRAVDEALAAKGFRPAAPATADFFVEYRAGVRDILVETPDQGPTPTGPAYIRGPVPGYGPPAGSRPDIEYTQGVLLVELVQRATGKLAFRATGREIVTPGGGSEEAVRDAVTRLLRDLPASGTEPR